MALLLPAATAEGDDGAHQAEDRRDQGAHVAADVVASGKHGVLRVGQPVDLGFVHEEEESVQATVLLVAVEPRLRHALSLELGHPGAGYLPHLIEVAELDRLGGAGLGTGGDEVVLEPRVAERALLGEARLLVEADHVIGAGRDAVAAAVAHFRLDVHGVELGPDDGVGRHTSMQLAIAQCLQTSLIMFHATPPLGVVNSWNCTWRQFWWSSCPVWSKLSRNCGSWPGSSFHSLQATSQALQPMQRVVSVKKPTVRAIASLLSNPHEIGHDLGEAALLRVQLEGQGRELVHQRHRLRVLTQIYGDQIPTAALAPVHPQVGKALRVRVDDQLVRGCLATGRAGHALEDPAQGAARAGEAAGCRSQRLAAVHEVSELWLSPALRAGGGDIDLSLRGADVCAARLEHRAGGGTGEKGLYG